MRTFGRRFAVDLVERFDDIIESLEATPGWVTSRVRRPILIRGSLDGVETGIRQLIRRRPLEVEEIAAPTGVLRIPTLAEMTRVKAWLVLRRNAGRDYIDLAALADRLGEEAVAVLLQMDDYYSDQIGPGGLRVATQLAKQLAEPAPFDLSGTDLAHYRGLTSRWQQGTEVAAFWRQLAVAMLGAAGSRGFGMVHRHLDYPRDTPLEERGAVALDDVLDRGDLEEWAPLVELVVGGPWGATANRLLDLCDAHPMYGTSALWRAFIFSCRVQGGAIPPPVGCSK